MATLKQIRQRIRDFLDARAENVEELLRGVLDGSVRDFDPGDVEDALGEIQGMRGHAQTAVTDLTDHIETEEPPPEPEPEPEEPEAPEPLPPPASKSIEIDPEGRLNWREVPLATGYRYHHEGTGTRVAEPESWPRVDGPPVDDPSFTGDFLCVASENQDVLGPHACNGVEAPAGPEPPPPDEEEPPAEPDPDAVIVGVQFDQGSRQRAAPGSDNWPVTWMKNGHQLTAWGDGGGYGGTNSNGRVSLGIARLEGEPESWRGVNVNGGLNPECGSSLTGKSYALLDIDGVIYMWRSPKSGRVGFQSFELMKSTDGGCTWTKPGVKFRNSAPDWSPFPDSPYDVMVPSFLQFGQGYAGARDEFVYVYLVRNTGRADALRMQSPGKIDLMRVPREVIEDKSAYEFFTGLSGGTSTWSPDPAEKVPVFEKNAVGWAPPSVTYHPGLDSYLLVVDHHRDDSVPERFGGSGMQMYVSEEPWGPWRLVFSADEWLGGADTFFYCIPAKWVSGTDFWLVFTGAGEWDSFNLIRGTLQVEGAEEPEPPPDEEEEPAPPPPPPPPPEEDGSGAAFIERMDRYTDTREWRDGVLAGTNPWRPGGHGWWGTPRFDDDRFGESWPMSVEIVDPGFDESAAFYGSQKPSGRTPDNTPLAAVADDPAYSSVEVPRVVKSLRFLWPDAVREGNVERNCLSAAPKLTLEALRPQGPFKELWAEWWMRLSVGWRTDSLSGVCDRSPDWKTFFMGTNFGDGSGDKRFEVKIGTFGCCVNLGTPHPGSCSGNTKKFLLRDDTGNGTVFPDITGAWFRVRFHSWVSSSSGACDGGTQAEIWHPQFRAFNQILDADTDGKDEMGGSFEVGDTFNLPVSPEQYAWWAHFRAWDTDPGWEGF